MSGDSKFRARYEWEDERLYARGELAVFVGCREEAPEHPREMTKPMLAPGVAVAEYRNRLPQR